VFVAAALLIAIYLLTVAGRYLGSEELRVLFLPMLIVYLVVALGLRSSFKAWRAGYSPIPRRRAERSIEVRLSAEAVLDLGADALRGLGKVDLESVERRGSVLAATTFSSGSSWGEHISISAKALSVNTATVTVRSAPVVSTNILDAGTNQANVDHLVRALQA
jgi:hypothetical protein